LDYSDLDEEMMINFNLESSIPPELAFESALAENEGSLDESMSTASGENSTVESLYTQSSKGSQRVEVSTKERRLQQRQKQIDYGKNTKGYQRYLKIVPIKNRKPSDPETPDKFMNCSKRAWDGHVRSWRRKLHQYDPPDDNADK
jgi:hypothetical protein